MTPGWPQELLAGLPASQRQVFLLRVRDDVPLPEIARRMGQPPAVVGSWLLAATRALRPEGEHDAAWLLEARRRLRQPAGPAAAAGDHGRATAATAARTPPPARTVVRTALLAGLAAGLVVGVVLAALLWWRGVAPPRDAAPATAAVPEWSAADMAVAAPDLELVAEHGTETELLLHLEFYRWLAETRHAPER